MLSNFPLMIERVHVSLAPLDTVSRRAGQRLQLLLLAGSKKTDWRLVEFPLEEEEGKDTDTVSINVTGSLRACTNPQVGLLL